MTGLSLAAIAGLFCAASPVFQVDGRLPTSLQQEAAALWTHLESLGMSSGLGLRITPRPVTIRAQEKLPPRRGGMGRPGIVWLRSPAANDEAMLLALRHEIAHQFLWQACPAASEDQLFHEAFVLAVTGELGAWEDGPYISLTAARDALKRSRSLDSTSARRALARLLSETPASEGLPRAIARRFSHCEAGTRWRPMTTADLVLGSSEEGDALVVVSRHSGQVLADEGAARVAMPFGSTLKPFLLAGARKRPPLLPPKRGRAEWICGPLAAEAMDAETALLQSCNGYFLDWMEADPSVVGFGRFGPALRALGLSAIPRNASEAIGIRPSLTVTPLGLAHAYRLLAEARPDIVDVLRRSPKEGTLSGLEVSGELSGLAAKTGTIRDLGGGPRLGWIAAVDNDLVVVQVRAGRAPRDFAPDLVRVFARFRDPGQAPAEVQVLGLLAAKRIDARCQGLGFSLLPEGPKRAAAEFTRLSPLLASGRAICLGGDWLVRYPGLFSGRHYAGVFEGSALPPDQAKANPAVSERARRARLGSEILFRTTRLLYTAGVLESEDSSIRGEARAALARVVAHNVAHSRHPGRPICDSTHCQVFQGTAAPRKEERVALRAPPPPTGDWLAFSRGGLEPWREHRGEADVEAILGAKPTEIQFDRGLVRYLKVIREGDAVYDEKTELSCELLRDPLKLPSCPDRAWREGRELVFEGRGAGHGEGLDVEWAKRSGLDANAILRRAYGF